MPDRAWISILALTALAGTALYLGAERRISGDWGFALDDSWIHATIARNFASGRGFEFNPGDRVAVSTAPLYTLALAFLYFIFRDVVWTAKSLGVICHIGSSIAIFKAMRAMEPRWRAAAPLAGLLVAAAPPLLWSALSGMELSLYLLCACLGVYCYTRDRPVAATAFWALGVWVRPDGLFLLVLSFAVVPGARRKRALLAASILLACAAFHRLVGVTWLPQTVGMKARFAIEPVARSWNMLREWGALWGLPYRPIDAIEQPAALLLLLLAGAAAALRGKPLLALYVIGFPLALSLFHEHSGSHKRYLIPVVPFGIVLAVQALARLRTPLPRARRATVLMTVGALCVVWQGAMAWRAAEAYGWNVQNINKMQRLLGEYARVATAPGDRVATNDIGAIGYWSERYVVDLMGLATPYRPLPEQLTRYRPRLLIVFVDWFKDYARWDSADQSFVFYDSDSTHKYTLVAGIELSRNTICARDQMLALARTERDAPAPAVKDLKRF